MHCGKDFHLMQLGAPVSHLKFSFKVAFIDRDRDGQLCGRSLDKVQAADSLFRQPVTIMRMTRLNEAGLSALEAQYNVELTRKGEETKSPDTELAISKLPAANSNQNACAGSNMWPLRYASSDTNASHGAGLLIR
jgi:hypothetical protein